MVRLWPLVIAAAVLAGVAQAQDLGPQGVVRRFCQLDGGGLRLRALGWATVEPLVAWHFEPAWDHVVLIAGYQVGGPYAADLGALVVDVRYNVLGQVSAIGQEDISYAETVSFRVEPTERGDWQILGPPPAPHLFASRLDLAAVRRTLAADSTDYLSNSGFVTALLRSSGWNVANERTLDLLSGATYRAVPTAAVGDLVAYLRDGAPYHVGLLADQDQVVSVTINAGVVRTPVDAFAGDVMYLRLMEPQPAATPTATAENTGALPAASAAPSGKPSPPPSPSARSTSAGKRRASAQPARHKRVKRARKTSKAPVSHAQATPTIH